MIEPVDPAERGEFDGFQPAPPITAANDLSLEEADHGLRQGVVIRIATAADGECDARVGQAIGVANRCILLTRAARVHQRSVGMKLAAYVLWRIGGKIRANRTVMRATSR